MGQTVNLLSFDFGGSNPSLPTNVLKKRMQTGFDSLSFSNDAIFVCLQILYVNVIAEVAQLIEH